ncbi:MAG TPA: serine hydrolase domain-containing protein [Myxococcales bacterium]|nr:serine hydrolase domain-containing protein [Myxococcales bacterium]
MIALALLAAAASTPPDAAIVAHFDAEIPRLMTRWSVPGAVAAVVRNGQPILIRGYGLADVERREPVAASATRFRIASVSKVFTAIVALQLAAEGKLPVDADVRRWVADLPIAGGPVSERDLLTHTAGFEDHLLGYLNPRGQPPPALGELLSRDMPPRTRPPGVPGYSNHGYALAALVAERAAGKPFEQLVHDRILAPLRMASTGFALLPDEVPGLATEYRSSGAVTPRRSSRPYPAGNLATTGEDMARFLVALGDSSSVLAPAVAAGLAGNVLRYHPALPPMGYGLAGVPVGGTVVWMKGGASPSHSAVLALVPALGLSLFLAENRQEPSLWNELIEGFVGKFVPAPPAGPAPPPDAVDGDYLWTRAPLRGVERVLGLAAQIRVARDPAGLTVRGMDAIAGRYRAAGGGLFRRDDGRPLAAGGERVFSIVDGQPVAFERIPFWRTSRAQLAAFALATAGLLAGGIAAAVRRGNFLALAAAALELCMLAAAAAVARHLDRLAEGPTAALEAGLLLATLASAVCVVSAIAAVRRRTLAWTLYAVAALLLPAVLLANGLYL